MQRRQQKLVHSQHFSRVKQVVTEIDACTKTNVRAYVDTNKICLLCAFKKKKRSVDQVQ